VDETGYRTTISDVFETKTKHYFGAKGEFQDEGEA
jgi:hypothetical protein